MGSLGRFKWKVGLRACWREGGSEVGWVGGRRRGGGVGDRGRVKVAITGTTPNCPNFGRVCANGKAVKGLETGWQIPISFEVRHIKGCHLDGGKRESLGNPHSG